MKLKHIWVYGHCENRYDFFVDRKQGLIYTTTGPFWEQRPDKLIFRRTLLYTDKADEKINKAEMLLNIEYFKKRNVILEKDILPDKFHLLRKVFYWFRRFFY